MHPTTRPSSKARAKGFSLLEVSIAMALVGLFATLSFPMMSRTLRRNELRRAARSVEASLQRARSLAVSGKRSSTGWAASERAVGAGLRITGASTYVLFIDKDTVTDGNEVAINTLTLPRSMVFDAPAPGQELRFARDGTVATPIDFVVRDLDLGQTKTITLTAAGLARIQ